MTDAPFADPAPRRRRDRDRAVGAAGETDSWAHLMGLGAGAARDAADDGAPAPVQGPAAGPVGVGPAAPASRREARRREWDELPQTPAPSGSANRATTASGGIPLRPWWASSTEAQGADPADQGGFPVWEPPVAPAPAAAQVPAAFRRGPAADHDAHPRPVPERPEAARGDHGTSREQAQVNPWPGKVRPALPTPGAVSGRRASGRTSDVAPDGSATAIEGAVDRGSVPPAVVDLPPAGGHDQPRAWPREVQLPQDTPVEAGRRVGSVTGRPVLPSAALPGPVLPGVEPFVEAVERSASPPSRAWAPEPDAPPRRPGPAARSLPSTPAAGATGEIDLRLVRDVAAARAGAPASGRAARPAGNGSGPPSSRRRLGASPVRFPVLGATGEPLPGAQSPEPPAPVSRGEAAATDDAPPATFSPPGRSRRRGTTPARGLPGAPSVSGPATGILGTGSLTPPTGLGTAPPGSRAAGATSIAAAGASAAGAAAAAAAAAAAGAATTPATVAAGQAAAAGSLAGSTLDVVAGLGRAGRAPVRRRPEAGTERPAARGAARPGPLAQEAPHSGQADEPGPPARRGERAPERDQIFPGAPPARSRRESLADAASPRMPLRAVATPPGDEPTSLLRPVPPASPAREDDAPAAEAAGRPRPRRSGGSRRSSGATAALSAVPAPAAASGRAGRNLPAAIGVGLGLAVAVLAALLVRKEAFVVLVAAAVVTALWELTSALAKKDVTVPLIPLAVGAVGMLVSAFLAGEDGLLVSFTLTAFGVLLWRLIDGAGGAARDVAAAVFVAAYVPFLAGFAMLMLAAPDGPYRVIVFIAVTVANDVGGYGTGVLLGRHPMAPSISPKKSWEGLAGSFTLCMLVGAGTVHYLLHGPLLAGVVVGAAAAATATLGDLSESLLKRDLGIKDMGHLLPGHGGIMDRLDSLLPTAPAVALLLALLVPVP